MLVSLLTEQNKHTRIYYTLCIFSSSFYLSETMASLIIVQYLLLRVFPLFIFVLPSLRVINLASIIPNIYLFV